MRSEHHAQGRQDCVELPIRVGQCFGVGGFPGQLDTEFGGPLLASLEQFWCQIRRDGPCASSGCRDSDRAVVYGLTAAGMELAPVVDKLGAWGMRWIGKVGEEDLDPKLLMWDLHRHVDPALVPPGRTVVSFRFNDVPAKIRDWWLVMTAEEVDVCDFDPGYDVAVSVTESLRRMVEIWRGDLGWPAAIRSGIIQLDGPERFRRAVPKWFPASQFAQVRRSAVDLTSLAG